MVLRGTPQAQPDPPTAVHVKACRPASSWRAAASRSATTRYGSALKAPLYTDAGVAGAARSCGGGAWRP